VRIVLWAFLVSLALIPSAQAASFDCAKASTFVEKAICSDKQLSSMDDQLAGLYKAARAANANAATVEADQKAWLSSRNQCADAACLKKAYAGRIAALSGSSAAPASGGFTGTYKMKNGEALVQETNGRIKFSINAAYDQNVGEVAGEAPLAGDTAKYVDQDADCGLSFKFAAGKLDLTQDGTCGMGLNVSGSGTYKRVSTAPPKFED
jgi:uncharacterized protein